MPGLVDRLVDRLAGRRPDVVVDFRCERGLLLVDLANVGDRDAHRIAVRFEPPFTGIEGTKSIPGVALFARTGFLPRARTLTTLVDTAAAYFARGEPTEITATVTFEDRWGGRHENRVAHDLAIFRDRGEIHGSE